jgi:hypothetical protein
VILTLHLDPAEYSLHAFYRDRICRAYVGASNGYADGRADLNRAAEFRAGDDILLSDLPPGRPLHLVCCAANDLSGDQVATLSRGAKSATLSRDGVAIGGYQAVVPRLTLGSALTASAAAFNSTMGGISKRLGPAVTFLMAALNLRLGIWVPHPAVQTPRRRLLPGLLFFKELFGFTDATPCSPDDTRTDVHLSDGGHFENLALYELVRRHCRYVVVVDAGEDLEVAFDDFGNAARRVREDFGVEIEIDLAPLTPGTDGRARQHVAVGTIHYDRQYDKGILVYLKPTMTGDEPPDILQYQRRSSAFPHEPTTDQFYDEAQWESYRRLGVHTALTVFRFVETLGHHSPHVNADRIFTRIRQEWWPTPADLPQRVLAATARYTAFEAQALRRPQSRLLSEVFPEVPLVAGKAAAKSNEDIGLTLTAVVEAAQVFEDVWVSCDLETQANHPLNIGWVNTFARWATAPSFHAWWPVVGPMFSSAFQQFMRERFSNLAQAPRTWVSASHDDIPPGLSADWWRLRLHDGKVGKGRLVFEYVANLPVPGAATTNVQLGLLLLASDPDATNRAIWTSEDFFVPPSLWGAGIGSAFLRGVLGALPMHGFDTCDVYIVNRHYETTSTQRTERIGTLEFYRALGFQVIAKGFGEQATGTLQKLVGPTEGDNASSLHAWMQLRWTVPARRQTGRNTDGR